MEQPSPLDPLALWRSLVTQTEKDVNQAADPTMKSGEFAKLANALLGASLTGKALKREMLDRYFGSLNLPTRSDLNALGNRLQAIEDQLVGMSAVLERLTGLKPYRGSSAGPLAAAPARTKRPPPAVRDAVSSAPAAGPAPAVPRKSRRTRS